MVRGRGLLKKRFIIFFLISLLAELGTTWVQGLRSTTDAAPGLYYPNFTTLLIDRLLTWLVIFAVLSVIWFLIVKGVAR
jgi:hypothetical protein